MKLNVSGHSFGMNSISVKSGETVRFLVRNDSRQHHDFAIGTPFKQNLRRSRLQGRFGASEPGASHRNSDKQNAFNAIALPPKSTRELIWWFKKAKNLEFACNMPGHYERGMKGKFVFSANAGKPRISSTRRKTTVATAQPVKKPARVAPKKQTSPAKNQPPVVSKHPPVTPVEQSPIFSAP